MIKKYCLTCKKEFFTYWFKVKNGRGKFCSKKCYWESLKGRISHWKGKKFSKEHIQNLRNSHKGIHSSPKTEFKKGQVPQNYKGNRAGYIPIHQWVKRHKGEPIQCLFCEKKKGENKIKRLQWANIDHKYRRNLADYIALCASCHKKYDLRFNNSKQLFRLFLQYLTQLFDHRNRRKQFLSQFQKYKEHK